MCDQQFDQFVCFHSLGPVCSPGMPSLQHLNSSIHRYPIFSIMCRIHSLLLFKQIRHKQWQSKDSVMLLTSTSQQHPHIPAHLSKSISLLNASDNMSALAQITPFIATHTTLSTTHSSRKRSHVTPQQLTYLERFFALDRSPGAAERKEISKLLGMQERQLQVWISNRRAVAKMHESQAHASVLANARL